MLCYSRSSKLIHHLIITKAAHVCISLRPTIEGQNICLLLFSFGLRKKRLCCNCNVLVLRTKEAGPGKVDQQAGCLLQEYEDLSSEP